MQPIKDLINKIKWDKRESPKDYSLIYIDLNKKKELVYTEIKRLEGNFMTIEKNNQEVEIPLHRIKEVKKKRQNYLEKVKIYKFQYKYIINMSKPIQPPNISQQEARRRVTGWSIQKRMEEEAKLEAKKRKQETRRRIKEEIKKRIQQAEKKNRYYIKENLHTYLEILEKEYGEKTPNQFFKNKDPEEISAEGKKLGKLFAKILARVLVIAKNGYEEIESLANYGRTDATMFLTTREGTRIKGRSYLMHNIHVIRAKVQLQFKKIFKYCKFLEDKDRLPRWSPFSDIYEFNNYRFIDWITIVEKAEMDILRKADSIINKIFSN